MTSDNLNCESLPVPVNVENLIEQPESNIVLPQAPVQEEKKEPAFIILEGPIGAGKTTAMRLLAKLLRERKGYKVYVCPEPVKKWVTSGHLAAFYKDKERNGYLFQTMAIASRVNAFCEMMKDVNARNADFIIMDRCWMTDKIFVHMLHEMKNMSDLEFSAYEEYRQLMFYVLSLVYKIREIQFFYLDVSVEQCLQHIDERKRESEVSGVSAEYLTALKATYDKIFDLQNHETLLNTIVKGGLNPHTLVFVHHVGNSYSGEFVQQTQKRKKLCTCTEEGNEGCNCLPHSELSNSSNSNSGDETPTSKSIAIPAVERIMSKLFNERGQYEVVVHSPTTASFVVV